MPTYTGQFVKGMPIGSETHKDFELREMTTDDLLAAEMVASPKHRMNFSAALAVEQLVRVGTYTGPFTLSLIKKLPPQDFLTLQDALEKVAELGEG